MPSLLSARACCICCSGIASATPAASELRSAASGMQHIRRKSALPSFGRAQQGQVQVAAADGRFSCVQSSTRRQVGEPAAAAALRCSCAGSAVADCAEQLVIVGSAALEPHSASRRHGAPTGRTAISPWGGRQPRPSPSQERVRPSRAAPCAGGATARQPWGDARSRPQRGTSPLKHLC
jgi:hypothetical protein